MLRAVVLDFDGLILDTERATFEAWQAVFASYSQGFPLQLWLENVGTTNSFDPIQYLETLLNRPIDIDGLKQAYDRIYSAKIEALEPLPGVLKVIQEAQSLGLRLGVASSSTHKWVDLHLQRLDLYDQFACIVCRDDVGGRAKPDPAVYKRAAECLGVAPHEALALEDSLHGAVSAQAAELDCIVVPNSITRHLDLSIFEKRLSSLEDLSLTAYISAL